MGTKATFTDEQCKEFYHQNCSSKGLTVKELAEKNNVSYGIMCRAVTHGSHLISDENKIKRGLCEKLSEGLARRYQNTFVAKYFKNGIYEFQWCIFSLLDDLFSLEELRRDDIVELFEKKIYNLDLREYGKRTYTSYDELFILWFQLTH